MKCFSIGVSIQSSGGDKNWRNRRSQKLDKMELLNLQSSLQSEIQAKQAINEELSSTRSELIAAQKYVSNYSIYLKLVADNPDSNSIKKLIEKFTVRVCFASLI